MQKSQEVDEETSYKEAFKVLSTKPTLRLLHSWSTSFIGPRYTWGLIFGSGSMFKWLKPCCNLTDACLADEDTNSILTGDTNWASWQCTWQFFKKSSLMWHKSPWNIEISHLQVFSKDREGCIPPEELKFVLANLPNNVGFHFSTNLPNNKGFQKISNRRQFVCTSIF